MGGKASTLKLKLDINGKCGEDKDRCNCDNSGKFVAEKKTDDPVKGFTKYAHSVTSGTFTLDGELKDGGRIVGFAGTRGQPIHKVKEVSVYYWDQAETKPLLLEVKYGGGTTIYYVSSGSSNDWVYHGILQGPALEQKLDDLNCQHNSAVTIDLSKTRAKDRHSYCCGGNHNGGAQGSNRVIVKKQEVSCNQQDHISTRLTYYKHEVNTSSGTGIKLAAIKYNDSRGKRKRIEIPGFVLPTNDSVKVYVFYCNNNPKLVYVESTVQTNVKGWFKNGSGDTWEPFSGINENREPEKITNCNNGFKELVKELQNSGCSLSQCTLVPPKPAPLPQPISGQARGGSGVVGSSPPGKNSKGPNLYIIVPSVLVPSGSLTVLAYWAYTHTRDPWVRQI
ncbi:hypothetical protein BEWA_053990 [Theileria equi strain WA]|uniref:Uncharacterized protein n=1 Tax=Theileria equi strain WA TaxID=1537102 RepID=L1LDX1_THEEQ|nr:hypothetical protein BEWA_053990 [Theileria equi strain WA]EKX73343.1 hypothetical protein BEWA_053990 [Theileria equi strain WA]|eukprot:XP_004832795.1 hypothetical protein BEWA_053990 [Theileria equi strain WA]